MSDDGQHAGDGLDLPRLFPWLRLFRAPGLATDRRKLVLAAFGVMVLWLGYDALDRLFPASAELTATATGHASRLGQPQFAAERVGEAFARAADPVRLVLGPLLGLFEVPTNNARFLHAALATLWAIAVWSLAGGAIARIAAVQSATGGRPGVGAAARFALGRAYSLVAAPLSPLTGIAFLAALCALLGLVYRLPGTVGGTIGGVLAFLPLAAGLLMALMLVGLVAGWPLMVASVAVEANDGFDALSRSYSYVLQRPGRYALYVGLAWALGAVGSVLATAFARLVVHLALWGLAFGAPDGKLLSLYAVAGPAPGTAGAVHFGWLTLFALLAYSWVFSYFWTAATQVYLLLRHDVDGAALDEVALAQALPAVPAPAVVPEPAPTNEEPAIAPEVAQASSGP